MWVGETLCEIAAAARLSHSEVGGRGNAPNDLAGAPKARQSVNPSNYYLVKKNCQQIQPKYLKSFLNPFQIHFKLQKFFIYVKNVFHV